MIKFFRKIRQKLLVENKLSRYLVYALGEIVLVVIGILIALQINNWNQNRNNEAFEMELLKSFQLGLQQDLQDIDGNITRITDVINANNELINLLESNRAYDTNYVASRFADAFMYTRFVYSTSAFETLKSKGINAITNENLRNKIIEVYDSRYGFFLASESVYNLTIEEGVNKIFSSRFEQAFSYDVSKPKFPGVLKPLDFEALKNDQEFMFFIKTHRNRTVLQLDFHYNKLRQGVVELQAEIEREIQNRTNL